MYPLRFLVGSTDNGHDRCCDVRCFVSVIEFGSLSPFRDGSVLNCSSIDTIWSFIRVPAFKFLRTPVSSSVSKLSTSSEPLAKNL